MCPGSSIDWLGSWTRPMEAILSTSSPQPRFYHRIVLNILPVSSHLIIPSKPTMFSHRIVLIRPSVPSHPITPTVPHLLSTVSTHRRPEWSSIWNHDLEMELIDPHHSFPDLLVKIRLIVEPEST
ncbi:hypothetical protein YC2023_072494 [Brassica napus]